MIEAYCKQFFGYGRWDAPVWFVGLEAADDCTTGQLQARLRSNPAAPHSNQPPK